MITRPCARRPRALTLAFVVAALAFPPVASAMPIDNGPAPEVTTAPPEVRTVVQSPSDTLPIALSGTALLLAAATAGYSAVRLAPLRRASS
jgi:hypothetical protein